MKNIKIDVGHGYDDYTKLDRIFTKEDFAGKFKEDILKEHPYLFHDNGNERSIHISILNEKDIDEILKISEKEVNIPKDSALVLSVEWNIPRKKYNDNFETYPFLSGFFYHKKDDTVIPGHNISVSNNIRSPAAYERADKIIAYINEANREYIKENKKSTPRKKQTLGEKLDKAKKVAAEKNTDTTKKRKKQEIE